MSDTTPEYVRDFLVEAIRDYLRDNEPGEFESYDELVSPVNDTAALVFTDPYDRTARFRVEVTPA